MISRSRHRPKSPEKTRDRRPAASKPAESSPAEYKRQYLEEASVWLKKRWERARDLQQSTNNTEFRPWYYEEPTDRQLNKIRELGLSKMAKDVTRGQVSDLIGLFESPSDEHMQILKFFKVPSRGFSETRARDEIEKLFRSEENRATWERRPPTTMQKEFYLFFGLAVPKKLTLMEMRDDIKTKLKDMTEEEQNDWDMYENIYDDLADAEFAKDEGLKKVSLKVYRGFVLKKRADGAKVRDWDAYEVAEELLEEHPELARSGSSK